MKDKERRRREEEEKKKEERKKKKEIKVWKLLVYVTLFGVFGLEFSLFGIHVWRSCLKILV